MTSYSEDDIYRMVAVRGYSYRYVVSWNPQKGIVLEPDLNSWYFRIVPLQKKRFYQDIEFWFFLVLSLVILGKLMCLGALVYSLFQ